MRTRLTIAAALGIVAAGLPALPAGGVPIAAAAPAPQGRVVFVSEHAENGNDLGISIMNADGSDVRQIWRTRTQKLVAKRVAQVRLSPDGRRIVFAFDREDYRRSASGDVTVSLFVMDSDGANLRRLTKGPLDEWPSFSPDGKRIVFTRDRVVHVIPTKGEAPPRRITARGQDAFTPSFSPDGSRIVYVIARFPPAADGEGYSEVFVTRADGTGVPAQLTRETDVGGAFHPSYSPNGRHILFARENTVGYSRLWLMRADGTREQRIPIGRRLVNVDPTFSPNGEQIIYAAEFEYLDADDNILGDQFELFRTGRDGSNRTRLTGTRDVNETSPSWSR